ncbi:MAG TPA: NAD(P)H-hydrate dehydratase [Pseudogracilibacillus sp.]|nr:NAD(P)H-hydrate dehydratase [Pseudogracilibacillus sp.]
MFIVTAKEMYDIDCYTKKELGFKNLLMENAGRAVCDELYSKLNTCDKIIVFVGTGNNGGDGYVIARTLLNEHFQVIVVQVGQNEKMTEETRFHKQLFLNCEGTVIHWDNKTDLTSLLSSHTVVIDALIGVGVKGSLRAPMATIVTKINELANVVISIDVPSGLPADEGITAFSSIRADYTMMIGAAKVSAFLQNTAPYYGKWDVVSIGYPPKAFEKYTARRVALSKSFKATMPKRRLDSYKGTHGKGMIIGGCDNMPGALSMAVSAAIKSGSGLLTAATTEKTIDRMAALNPEAMYMVLKDDAGFISSENHLSLEGYDAIALGVGIGREKGTGQFVHHVLEQAHCPIIIDADGISHMKQNLDLIKRKETPMIVTPHFGELAHLMDISVKELIRKPFYYSSKFACDYHVYIILKGRFTIITSPNGKQTVDMTGNPGLAKGGSGDVLTGITLAMVMQQNMPLFDALCNACFIHGMAADIQVEDAHSHYDLKPTDVIAGIPKVYRTFL